MEKVLVHLQGRSMLHHVTLALDGGRVNGDGAVHAGLKPDAVPRDGEADDVRFSAVTAATAATVYPLESLGESVRRCEICNQRWKLDTAA